jgi:hypothetical protein
MVYKVNSDTNFEEYNKRFNEYIEERKRYEQIEEYYERLENKVKEASVTKYEYISN